MKAADHEGHGRVGSKKSVGSLCVLLAAAGCVGVPPPLPPPPEEPKFLVDNPTCVSCIYDMEGAQLEAILAKARAGDAEAAFRAARHYEAVGNRQESDRWHLRAAELGYRQAQFEQWVRLGDSDDCADRQVALAWLEKSAAQGYEIAVFELDRYRSAIEPCPSADD